MLRAVLLLVALLILLVIGAVWLGLLDLNQTQNAQAPKFEVNTTRPRSAPPRPTSRCGGEDGDSSGRGAERQHGRRAGEPAIGFPPARAASRRSG